MYITEFHTRILNALIVSAFFLIPLLYVVNHISSLPRVGKDILVESRPVPKPQSKPILLVNSEGVQVTDNGSGAGEFIYTIVLSARDHDVYLQPASAFDLNVEDDHYQVSPGNGSTSWYFLDEHTNVLDLDAIVHIPKDTTKRIILRADYEAACGDNTSLTYRLVLERVRYGPSHNRTASEQSVLVGESSPFITVLSRTCEDSPEANTYDYSSESTSEDQVIAIEGDPLEPQIGDPGDLNCYETPCGPLIESDPYDLDQKG